MKKEERTEITGRTPWDLAIGLLRQISWAFIIQMLCLALLGIPVLKLYILFFPDVFSFTVKPRGVEYVLVPANQLWIDSCIVLNPGQRVRLTANGTVNLAVHRLIEAAQWDVYPPFRWIGPAGGDFDKTRPLYMRRRKLLIDPEVNPGCLLMYASPEGISVPNARPPNRRNPRPKPLLIVGKGPTEHENKTRFKQRLFFTVNEKVMEDSERARAAFIGTQEDIDKTYRFQGNGQPHYTVQERCEAYDRIVSMHYWELWFDDNIGQFLVKIEFLGS